MAYYVNFQIDFDTALQRLVKNLNSRKIFDPLMVDYNNYRIRINQNGSPKYLIKFQNNKEDDRILVNLYRYNIYKKVFQLVDVEIYSTAECIVDIMLQQDTRTKVTEEKFGVYLYAAVVYQIAKDYLKAWRSYNKLVKSPYNDYKERDLKNLQIEQESLLICLQESELNELTDNKGRIMAQKLKDNPEQVQKYLFDFKQGVSIP